MGITSVRYVRIILYGSIITVKYEKNIKGVELKPSKDKKRPKKWFRNSITVIIIFVLIYLILNWFARTSSKKIAKSIRYIIIAFSLVLAAIFFLVGRYAFSIPVLFLLIPLLKLKGLTFFQLFQLFRLLKYLRQTGRFSYASGTNYSKSSSNITLDDAYNILGLKKGCSTEEVLSKYKKIMQKLHPDSNQDINTTKLAQIVSEAKETIIKNDFS